MSPDYSVLKIENTKLNENEIRDKKIRLGSTPVVIHLELTNACNLNCMTCARNYWDDSQNPSGFMTIDTVKKLEPFYKKANQIILFGYGEALLSPVFWDAVNFLNKFSCKYHLFTNGTTIGRENSHKILENDFVSLTVSIDAADKDLFKKLRSTSFDIVMSNMKYFYDLKLLKKKSDPEIGISFTATRGNIDELPKLIRLCPELGVSVVKVSIARIFHHSLIGDLLLAHREYAFKVLDEAKKIANDIGIIINWPDLANPPDVCLQPFQSLFIKWNGHARVCCASAFFTPEPLSIYVGNINETPCDELWNSPNAVAAREGMLDKNKIHPVCKECAFINFNINAYDKCGIT